MFGWIIRVAGIIGLLGRGEITAAALVVIALIVAKNLAEGSFLRWVIDVATLLVGLFILFSLFFWLGLAALICCFAFALLPKPTSG